jgi:mannonate dehydratase
MDHIGQVTNEKLKFMQQLGVEGVMAEPVDFRLDKGYYEFSELMTLKTWVESYGMKLEASHAAAFPWQWNYKWMFGLPGRDEQIENIHKTVRNMGAAGIPLLLYTGAVATSFDEELVKNAPLMVESPLTDISLIPESHRRPYDDEEMWENLTYFLKAVVPVAEEAGVKLGLHPDDPPIPSIGGVARIMRSPEAFRRAIEIVPSDNSGLLFCQGCFTEMGADVLKEIRYFGSRNKIFWVHFRNVRGTADKFSETFPDDGEMDMVAAMKAYEEVGYEGYLVPDHALGLVGDTEWGHRYWAYALGHIRGLLQAVASS